MYLGEVTFTIAKSFGSLQLIPQASGLRLLFCPIEAGRERTDIPGYIDIVLPLEAIGGFLATAIAFFEREGSLAENVILPGVDRTNDRDMLFKLHHDKPSGPGARLSEAHNCRF